MKRKASFWHISLLCVAATLLPAQDKGGASRVTLLAFGDVNLGRTVGQRLLQGDLEYPFVFVQDTLSRAQVVFVNLESQLTDQAGETQHPRFNLVFCGPPEGAFTLKGANISVVSTANNHAYDYGLKGLRETIENLQAAGVMFTGTAEDSVEVFPPAIFEADSIKIGFAAYTQLVNLKGAWQGRIALFDERSARRTINHLRRAVDFVVASYHGGVEYVDRPTALARRQMKTLIDAGADVVIGHHPHYIQGIERYRGKLIFYSLGNFVFYQPQRYWAQKGLGVEFQLLRGKEGVSLERVRLLPFRAGLQPSFSLSSVEEEALIERIKRLSNVEVQKIHGSWFVQTVLQDASN